MRSVMFNGDSVAMFILAMFIGLIFGAALSVVFIFYRVTGWLLTDPDGPGGWKNRLEALNATHR